MKLERGLYAYTTYMHIFLAGLGWAGQGKIERIKGGLNGMAFYRDYLYSPLKPPPINV